MTRAHLTQQLRQPRMQLPSCSTIATAAVAVAAEATEVNNTTESVAVFHPDSCQKDEEKSGRMATMSFLFPRNRKSIFKAFFFPLSRGLRESGFEPPTGWKMENSNDSKENHCVGAVCL